MNPGFCHGSGRKQGAQTIRAATSFILLAGGCLLAAGAAAQDPAQGEVDELRPLLADGRVDVEVTTHALRIEVWDRAELQVTGAIDPAVQRFELTGDARSLTVRVVRVNFRAPPAPRDLLLRVPVGAHLSIMTTSGPVEVEGVSGSLRISTSSGAVRLAGTPDWAEIETFSGRVEVSGDLPDLLVRSWSGALDVRGSSGRLEASTQVGAIRLRGDAPLDHVHVRSMAGSVDFTGELTETGRAGFETRTGPVFLRVPESTPASYHLRSFSGRIRNRISEHEARSPAWDLSSVLTFIVGEGTARVQAASFGGSVTLDPLR